MRATVPVVCAPDLRECWIDPTYLCEAPVDVQVASSCGPFKAYDWSLVHEARAASDAGTSAAPDGLSAWETQLRAGDAKCNFLGDATGLRARSKRLVQMVCSRPEQTIAIVSHAALLDFVTEDPLQPRMANCVRAAPSLRGHSARARNLLLTPPFPP